MENCFTVLVGMVYEEEIANSFNDINCDASILLFIYLYKVLVLLINYPFSSGIIKFFLFRMN